MIAALLQAWKELKRGRKKSKKTGTRREKEREASATNPSERFRERIERRSEQIYIIHLNPLTGWLRPREQEQACSGLKASFLLFCFLPFLPLSPAAFGANPKCPYESWLFHDTNNTQTEFTSLKLASNKPGKRRLKAGGSIVNHASTQASRTGKKRESLSSPAFGATCTN